MWRILKCHADDTGPSARAAREELMAHLEGRSEKKRETLLKWLLSQILFQDNCPGWISLTFPPALLASVTPQVFHTDVASLLIESI